MEKLEDSCSSSKSPPPQNGPPSRKELVDMVRRAGISSGGKPVNKVPLSYSLSEPSSPRKLFRRLEDSFNTTSLDKDSSSTDSISTLTSEDGLTESHDNLPELHDNLPESHDQSKPSDSHIPLLVVSQDEVDSLPEFRSRTGSHFYHESFSSSFVPSKPVMYFPVSQSAQQLSVDIKLKKQGGIFRRLRNSFNKHKPITRTVSDKLEHRGEKGRRWIDHEDDLDPVSRPSYFRHLGHVVKTGPGLIQTIELNKPPHGKFGIYISQGIDPNSQSKSIFVSRFYQENMSRFYGGMLRPGDEILAVNGHLIRDKPVSRVTELLAGLETVQLTVLPIITKTDN